MSCCMKLNAWLQLVRETVELQCEAKVRVLLSKPRKMQVLQIESFEKALHAAGDNSRPVS